jgi:hypothetical protein
MITPPLSIWARHDFTVQVALEVSLERGSPAVGEAERGRPFVAIRTFIVPPHP